MAVLHRRVAPQHRLRLERALPRRSSTRRRRAGWPRARSGRTRCPSAAALRPFRASRSRLILLDYDGTLVPFAPRPREAVPSAARGRRCSAAWPRARRHRRHRLRPLARRPRALVRPRARPVAGRRARGAACARRSRASGRWRGRGPATSGRRACCPSSSTTSTAPRAASSRRRSCALVWHHRLADPEFGEWLANELVATLEEMLAETELRPCAGNKTVEVRLAWANKGAVVRPPASRSAPTPTSGWPSATTARTRTSSSACAAKPGRCASARGLLRALLGGLARRGDRVPGDAGERGGSGAARWRRNRRGRPRGRGVRRRVQGSALTGAMHVEQGLLRSPGRDPEDGGQLRTTIRN